MYAIQFSSASRRIFWISLCLFCALAFASELNAQQPTAEIIKIKGTVLVSFQGKPPMAATVGAILQAGDVIETLAVSSVGLRFSDGSELRLGQNSKVDLATLTQVPATKARESRVKLWYGSLRAWIAPEHQTTGSSFEVDTPNAMAGVKFSQPFIEVSYDPSTKTSLFKAYTVALIVRNSVTGEHKQIPQGLQVVVRDESTVTMPLPAQQIPSPQDDIPEAPQTEPFAESSMGPPGESPAKSLTESPAEIPKTTPEAVKAVPAVPAAPTNPSPPVQETRSNTTPSTTQTRESPVKSTNIAEQARYVSRGATSSSAPVSVGVVSASDSGASASSGESGATTTETSTNPSPGTRTESAEQRVYRPIIIRIHQE